MIPDINMETFDSPLGIIDLTSERENHIYRNHPAIRLAKVIAEPEVIRRSKYDSKVFILYQKLANKYLAIVVKANQRKYILTAYPSSNVGEWLIVVTDPVHVFVCWRCVRQVF